MRPIEEIFFSIISKGAVRKVLWKRAKMKVLKS